MNTCKGRCCEGSGGKIMVSLLPEEEEGRVVKGGLLQPCGITHKCPYKTKYHLCEIHRKDKLFGCVISPFTLNKSNTLIIRHRYSRLKCHGQGQPAYKVFRKSLYYLFGELQCARIIRNMNKGVKEIYVDMDEEIYNKLFYLDALKK